MLEPQELNLYIRRAKEGDEEAKTVIFKNNAPLLKSIIKNFKNKGIEYDDLYQIASMGLLKAINNFDESYNVKFSTYTVPMVVGEIKRYMRDNGAIKVSRTLKMLSGKINRYTTEYQAKNNASPTVEELAEHFGCEEDDILMALDSARMPVSLFEKADDDDGSLQLIDKLSAGDKEEELIEKIEISKILSDLSERERKIVVLRYFRDRTQSEIAKDLGVSQVQVSRLENKILEKIRLKF